MRPEYLSEQAATILHNRLVELDGQIDAKLAEITRANATIVEAGQGADALWVERKKLADELTKRTHPDWEPPSRTLAGKQHPSRRFDRKHPLPGVILKSSVVADEDDI